MQEAERSGVNPDLNKRYPDINDLRKACLPFLNKHELCLVQLPSTTASMVSVKTMLGHSSGEWLACTMSCMTPNQNIWAIGEATTYLRRYGMSAIGCITAGAENDGVDVMRQPGGSPTAGMNAPPSPSRTDAVRENLAAKQAPRTDAGSKPAEPPPKPTAPPSPKPESEPASKPAGPPEPKPGAAPPPARPQQPPPAQPSTPAGPSPAQPSPAPAPAGAAGGPEIADNVQGILDWLNMIASLRKRQAIMEAFATFKKQVDGGAWSQAQANAVLLAFKAKAAEAGRFFVTNAKSGQDFEQAEQFLDFMFTQGDPQVAELSSLLAAGVANLKKG